MIKLLSAKEHIITNPGSITMTENGYVVDMNLRGTSI